ncbi:hypothetical protein [Rhizocola hellebori]|uniref:hypothetical protein n=1 Tax=Rhizocola hellebori TaxID=1392758 RepID=UPI0019447624|nr:hypothetical protein [Rhizocola hellebori]
MWHDNVSRVEQTRRKVSAALDLADLASQVPIQLALVQDGFARLAAGVTGKATLAERYEIAPQAIAVSLSAGNIVPEVSDGGLFSSSLLSGDSPFEGRMSLGGPRREEAAAVQEVTVADAGALTPTAGPVLSTSDSRPTSAVSSIFDSILAGVMSLPSLVVSRAEAATPPNDLALPPIDRGTPVIRIPVRIAVGGDSLTAFTGIRDGRSSYTVTLPGGFTIEVPDTAIRSNRSPIEVAIEMLREKYPNYDIQLVNVSESGATPASMLSPGNYWWEPFRPAQADAFVGADIAMFGVGANPFAAGIAGAMFYPYPLGYLNNPWSTGYTPQEVFQIYHDRLMASSNRADLARLYDVAVPGVVLGGAVVAFDYPLMFTPGNDAVPVPHGGSEWLNAFTLSANALIRDANDAARVRWEALPTSVHYFGLGPTLQGLTYGMDPSAVNFGTRDLVGFFHPNELAVPPLARELFRQLEPVFLDQANRKVDEFLGNPPRPNQRPFPDPGTRTEAEPLGGQTWSLATDANGDIRYELSDTRQPGPTQLTSVPEPSGSTTASWLDQPAFDTASLFGDTEWSDVDYYSYT